MESKLILEVKGIAGTGKTKLLETLKPFLEEKGYKVSGNQEDHKLEVYVSDEQILKRVIK